MSKYSRELKLRVVQDYEEFNTGTRLLSKKYALPRTLLRSWIYGYRQHGAAYFDAVPQRYSAEFKLKVLQHMKDHHLSLMKAAAHFGITSASSILQWQRLYNADGESALEANPRGRPKMTKPKQQKDKAPQTMTAEELLEEVLNLRAERDYLKKLHALIQRKPSVTKRKQH